MPNVRNLGLRIIARNHT